MYTKRRTLNKAEKISIINSLMQEDRAEIRMNKNILLTTTYFVVSGVVAVSAFAISHNKTQHLTFYLIGMWSLFVLYISTFFFFKKHLIYIRKCLDIRENYYKDLNLLEKEDPFDPLKPIDGSKKPSLNFNYMYFLPVITFLVTAANTCLLTLIF